MNSQLTLLNKMLILSMLTNKFNVIQTKKKQQFFLWGREWQFNKIISKYTWKD